MKTNQWESEKKKPERIKYWYSLKKNKKKGRFFKRKMMIIWIHINVYISRNYIFQLFCMCMYGWIGIIWVTFYIVTSCTPPIPLWIVLLLWIWEQKSANCNYKSYAHWHAHHIYTHTTHWYSQINENNQTERDGEKMYEFSKPTNEWHITYQKKENVIFFKSGHKIFVYSKFIPRDLLLLFLCFVTSACNTFAIFSMVVW